MRRLSLRWMGIFPLFIGCLTAVVYAQSAPRIEVYPKPVLPGDVFFVGVEWRTAPGSAPEQLERRLWVDEDSLPAELLSLKNVEPGVYRAVLKGKTSKGFDWRNIRIRLGGKDYPAGPDDPYMICDAPFRVKSPTVSLPLSATFHDADEDDVQLQYVEVFDDLTGDLIASYPIWEWISTPYRYYLFTDLTAENFNAAPGDTVWIKMVLHCDDHDWPFIPEEYTFTQHLKIRVGRDLPSFPGWYYGDVHTHSQYTNNIYEYGGPLEMFVACAEAIGLSFATISDHSSDFDASGNLWQQMADDCATYSSTSVKLVPAEEVTLDDNEIDDYIDNRIHFLNYSGQFIRGPEAPISGCMDTSNRFTFFSEAIAQMEPIGGFGYAAHPFQAFDPFVAMLGMAMMTWSDENYAIGRASESFRGLELWNERNRYKKNVSYWYELNPFPWQDNPDWAFECSWITDGIAQWDDFLSEGLVQNLSVPLLPQKLFVSAGSDCHGDFNYRTYNTDPIFFDVYATDNAFGVLRTAVHVNGVPPGTAPSEDDILTALRMGRSVLTDGPFLIFGLDVNGDGDLDDSEDVNIGDDIVLFTDQADTVPLLVRWQSTEDWGAVETVVLFRGSSSTGSSPDAVWSYNPDNYQGTQNLTLSDVLTIPSDGWMYLRAEAFGVPLPDDARRAITNPIWIRVDEPPTASVRLEPTGNPIFIAENGGSFDYTIRVQNHESSPTPCDIWLDVVLPDNTVYPLASANMTLSPDVVLERTRTQTVPAPAPAGNYVYRAHIGDYPDPWFTDAFLFTKLGSVSSEADVEGWLQPQDELVISGEAESNRVTTESEQLQIEVFPTPFNAVTTIEFTLPRSCQVRLEIFDLRGNRITTLEDDRLASGRHSLTWDAGDTPSGIYFYRLAVDGTARSGKIILLK